MRAAGKDAAEGIAGLETFVQSVAAVGIDQHRQVRVLVGMAVEASGDGPAGTLEGQVFRLHPRLAAAGDQGQLLAARLAGLLFREPFDRRIVPGGMDKELESGLQRTPAHIDGAPARSRPQHRSRQRQNRLQQLFLDGGIGHDRLELSIPSAGQDRTLFSTNGKSRPWFRDHAWRPTCVASEDAGPIEDRRLMQAAGRISWVRTVRLRRTTGTGSRSAGIPTGRRWSCRRSIPGRRTGGTGPWRLQRSTLRSAAPRRT